MEISVNDLFLDEWNYRIGQAFSQKDALERILDEQGPKLIALANDIVKMGLSPIENIAVYPAPVEGKWVVAEGNRRIAALKILNDPSIIKGSPFHNLMSQAAAGFSKSPIHKIQCVLLKSREEALPWLDRRHSTSMNGAGIEPWGPVATAYRRRDRGDYLRWLAVLDFLREKGFQFSGIEDLIVGHVSAIERVLSSRFLRDRLGIEIRRSGEINFHNDFSEDRNVNLLKDLFRDLITQKLTTDHIRYKEQQEAYLSQYLMDADAETVDEFGELLSDETTAETTIETENSKPEKEVPTKRPIRKPKRLRKTLASKKKADNLLINHDGLNSLYHDCREVDVVSTPRLAHAAVRMFLELSLTLYLIERPVKLPPDLIKGGGVSKWTDRGVKIEKKLEVVLKDIDPKKRDRTLDDARRSTSKDFTQSIKHLHAAMHELEYEVLNAGELISIWDRFSPLFKRIFGLLLLDGLDRV